MTFQEQLQQARREMEQRQHADALGSYAALLEQFPQSGLWSEYGRAAAGAGDFELADQIWEKVRSLEPTTPALLLRLAGEYAGMYLFSKARALSLEAAALAPGDLPAQLNLASFLARTSSIDDAREALDRCLKLDPRREQARYLSAHLDRRENKLAAAEAQFRDLLAAAPRDPQVVYFTHFELARILDGTNRFDEAMAQLGEAKNPALQDRSLDAARNAFDQRREHLVSVTRSLPRNILALWGELFPASERTAAPPLAFLGGHARSGTTLLEKILDAHPGVAACDESLAFKTISPLIDIAEPEIPARGLNFLRRRYLKNITLETGSPGAGKILLDKNPAATAHLPAFLRAFPDLRALIALRDPRDVLVSCYFQNLPLHHSWEHLARHYRGVMDIWLAVREWGGLAWMETRYEDLVADVAKEGARVTSFLGLDWHGDQTQFHARNREKPVLSTNYNDVTQPVYKHAVGRWQDYEKHLAPILPVLEPYCRRFGYG